MIKGKVGIQTQVRDSEVHTLLYHAARKARNEQVGKAIVKVMYREIKRVKGFVQSKVSRCKW